MTVYCVCCDKDAEVGRERKNNRRRTEVIEYPVLSMVTDWPEPCRTIKIAWPLLMTIEPLTLLTAQVLETGGGAIPSALGGVCLSVRLQERQTGAERE